MKNYTRNILLAFMVLVQLFAFVITLVLCIKFISALSGIAGSNMVISKYSIIAMIAVCVNFLVLCLSIYFSGKEDNLVSSHWRNGLLCFSFVVLGVVLITYVVTNTNAICSVYDIMEKSANNSYYNTELSGVLSALAYVETMLQNNIMIFAIINCVATVLTGCLLVKTSSVVENNEDEERSELSTKEECEKLSQNDIMKKEITEIKEAIELENLKAEYAQLYAELQNKKNKNADK